MDWIPVALLGMLGAAIPEVLRVIAALKKGRGPGGRDWLASGLLVLLGAGVLLFGQAVGNPLQIAVTGAAFPQLFSGLVAAAKPPQTGIATSTAERSVWQYLAWEL